mmetsp:Transcript_79125/g.140048  ORF Transcript_79125/g.140048 Transcript_79125/m.140048 type:complete len:281 (+) Transcript_79125:295-1137(+)
MEFFPQIPSSFDAQEWDGYASAVDGLRIDNFGCVGTRLLLDWMGIPKAPEDFCLRALQDGWIPRLGRLVSILERGPGVTWIRTRVVSYVVYDLQGPGVELQGEEAAENAYHGEVLRDSRWLRAVTPPFNPFADRRTCSEFRFFDRLIELLAHAGVASDPVKRAQVRGHITIQINAPPCVSCIGVIRQFQMLFPGVMMRISGGQPVHVRSDPDPARDAALRGQKLKPGSSARDGVEALREEDDQAASSSAWPSPNSTTWSWGTESWASSWDQQWYPSSWWW